MKSFEEVEEVVKSRLSEKRFYHSNCVKDRCVEYAKIYGEDVEKARLAMIWLRRLLLIQWVIKI